MRNGPAAVLVVAAGFLAAEAAEQGSTDDAAIKKEIQAQYEKLGAAHEREDLAAILALKTPDFHAIFPDGRVGDAKVMEEYSRQFLASNEPPYNTRFTIEKLTVSEHRLIAVADVLQEVTRYRDLEGKRRLVATGVRQRETWSKTPQGWKLKSVDGVHDQKTFVDGKRIEPGKPYDPDAPPYDPDER
jgi:ketosteroid isomerase-like protein